MSNTWDSNFPNVVSISADTIKPIPELDNSFCLPYFPCVNNITESSPSNINLTEFYSKKDEKSLLDYVNTLDKNSLTVKIGYLIAKSRMNVKLSGDQKKIEDLFKLGEKGNWRPWVEYMVQVENEKVAQDKLGKQLQSLFEKQADMVQSSITEERQVSFNPLWDEIKFRLKGNKDVDTIPDYMKYIQNTLSSKLANNKSFLSVALTTCKTDENEDLMSQYLSWSHIDFRAVPSGSSVAWSGYTSFRLSNLLEKQNEDNRRFKNIREDNSSKTELIRSLLIRPLSSLYELADIDEIVLDSPIERFNALTTQSGVQWYSSIIDNKPQGVRLTHFSNLKYYLHYCSVRMGKGDRGGFYGWLQFLYFLGSDIVASLQDAVAQVKEKLEIYVEDHESEKDTVDPVLDYLGSLSAQLDKFFDFWVNRMRTQYGLVPPPGLENDPNWSMGFRQFSMNELKGGDATENLLLLNNNRGRGRGKRGRNDFPREKKKSVMMAIPNYIICHQIEGRKLWPLESIPESSIMSVKDTKSAFAGLTSTPVISVFSAVGQQAQQSQQPVMGSPVNPLYEAPNASSIQSELKTVRDEIEDLLTNKQPKIQGLDTQAKGNNGKYKELFEALKATAEELQNELKRKKNVDLEKLRDLQEELSKAYEVLKNSFDNNNYPIVPDIVKSVKEIAGKVLDQKKKPYKEIASMAGGAGDKKKKDGRKKRREGDRDRDNYVRGSTREGKYLRQLEEREIFERKMAERQEYPFTGVSVEITDKEDSIFWLREFKVSYRSDEGRFDDISFKWWSGSARTIDNDPFYLGGAGVRIEGESSFGCGISYVLLANRYAILQKSSTYDFMKVLSNCLTLSIPQSQPLLSAADIQQYALEAYNFLLVAIKEFGVVQAKTSRKSNVPSRSQILFESALLTAIQKQWIVMLSLPTITISNNTEKTKFYNNLKKLGMNYETQSKGLFGLLKISREMFNKVITDKMGQIINMEIPQPPIPGVNTSGVSSSGVSSSGVSSLSRQQTPGFKTILDQVDGIVGEDRYWQSLVDQMGGRKVYIPFIRDSGRVLTVDYVLDYLQVGLNAKTIVRQGRGVDFSRLLAGSKAIKSGKDFANVIGDGDTIVANNPLEKANSRTWRRTSVDIMRKYIIMRMRQINREADIPGQVFTPANFRRVWFELMINTVAYQTMMQAPWSSKTSRLKVLLIQQCGSKTGSYMEKCPIIFARTNMATWMGAKGLPLPGMDWSSGMMKFRSKPTLIESVIETKRPGVGLQL